jgi:dipeptidyl aminopeptidase/acylaminoacyl peptidase
VQRVLVHGDADTEVPFQQSVAMEAALRAVNVPTKLVRLPGGGHGATFPIDGRPNGKPHPELSNAIDEMVRWLNQYLKSN